MIKNTEITFYRDYLVNVLETWGQKRTSSYVGFFSFLFLRACECTSGHDTACYRVSPYTRRRHDLSCFDDNVMMTKRVKNYQLRKTLSVSSL